MTQGCRWQEKSFNVMVEDKPSLVCAECSVSVYGDLKYNGDYLCKDCFHKKPSRISLGEFNTNKDLSYNFTTEMFNGKPVEIHSKRQFKNLLKKHNIADASPKECFQEARFRKRLNEEGHKVERRNTAEKIYRKMKERGQL